MSKTPQTQAFRFIVRWMLPAWLLWLGMTTAGCASTTPATGGGAPLSPTPGLTATAASAVLEQALANAPTSAAT